MKKVHLIGIVTLLLIGLLTWGIGPVMALESEEVSKATNEPPPTVYARVNGEMVPLEEGMVIHSKDYEVFASGNKFWNHNSITTERVAEGWLVTKITWKHIEELPTPPDITDSGRSKKAGPPEIRPLEGKEVSAHRGDQATLSDVERLGWARTTIKWLGISVTRTYGEMQYWDSGSQVYDGHDYDGECWYVPPFYIDVEPDSWWWPYGPNYVYETTEGEYQAGTAYSHTARATFYGYPDGDWGHSHYVSDLPLGYSVVEEANMYEL